MIVVMDINGSNKSLILLQVYWCHESPRRTWFMDERFVAKWHHRWKYRQFHRLMLASDTERVLTVCLFIRKSVFQKKKTTEMKLRKLMSSEKNILHTFSVTLPYSRMQTFLFIFPLLDSWLTGSCNFFSHSKFLSVYLLRWKEKNGKKHRTTCRMVRSGWGGNKKQKLETKEINFVWIIPKKGKK